MVSEEGRDDEGMLMLALTMQTQESVARNNMTSHNPSSPSARTSNTSETIDITIKREPLGYSMDDDRHALSPSPDKVSSAAAAMLKLSALPVGPTFGFGSNGIPDHSMNFSKSPDMSSSNLSMSPGNSQFSHNGDALSPLPNGSGSLQYGLSKSQRRQREFTPDTQKDNCYWLKRSKNNEAAKRSREKRRVNDMVMSKQVRELMDKNSLLVDELVAIKKRFGLPVDKRFTMEPDVPERSHRNHSQVSGSTQDLPSYMAHYKHLPDNGRVSSSNSHFISSSPDSSSPEVSGHVTQSIPSGSHALPALIPVSVFNRQLEGLQQQDTQQHQQHQHHQAITTSVTSSPPGLIPASMVTSLAAAQSNRHGSMVTQAGQHAGLPNTTAAHYRSNNIPIPEPSVMAPEPYHPSQVSPQAYPGQNSTDIGRAMFSSMRMNMQREASPERPVSPADSMDSSPRSLTISFSAASSGAESDGENPSKYRPNYYGNPVISNPTTPTSSATGSPTNKFDRSRERKGIPHKLRHKEQFMHWAGAADTHLESTDTQLESTDINTQLESPEKTQNGQVSTSTTEPAFNQDVHGQQYSHGYSDGEESESMSSSDSYNLQRPLMLDECAQERIDMPMFKKTKYSERRQKNNQAARKCRENRRQLNDIRMARSQLLEQENTKLRDELRHLSDEVHGLKDWLQKKNEAKAKGVPFQLPMIAPATSAGSKQDPQSGSPQSNMVTAQMCQQSQKSPQLQHSPAKSLPFVSKPAAFLPQFSQQQLSPSRHMHQPSQVHGNMHKVDSTVPHVTSSRPAQSSYMAVNRHQETNMEQH